MLEAAPLDLAAKMNWEPHVLLLLGLSQLLL